MLVYVKRENEGLRICDIRSQMKEQLTTLDFAHRLCHIFRALINGTIDGFKKKLGKTAGTILAEIDERLQMSGLIIFSLKRFSSTNSQWSWNSNSGDFYWEIPILNSET